MRPTAPPPAPDPVTTAKAQGDENRKAAISQFGMNAVDQVSPYGSLTYEQNGTWADGTPRYRATTSLSKEAQDTVNKQISTENKFADTAGKQLDSVRGVLSTGFKVPTNLPTPKQFAFEDYDKVMKSMGPSLSAPDFKTIDPNSIMPERQRIEQAIYDRAAPQLQSRREAAETKLKNQGFDYGSEGWRGAMDDVSRAENDFRLGVTAQGGQEQRNIFDMMSTAQGQDYAQKMGLRQQQIDEAFNPYDRTNADFGNTMALRQQLINESLTERNQPLSELSTLMTGAQPKMPTFQSTPQSRIDPADIAGLYGQQWQGQMQGWNAQNQSRNAMLGGLFGLGGAALGGWARGGFGGAR